MSDKHTPGPWEFGEFVVGPQGQVVADVHCGPTVECGDEMEANGTLIAAAPELLEALKMAMPLVGNENVSTERLTRAWKIIEAALSKATGGK